MSSTVSIVDNDGKNLDADSIQDPEQILELESIHAVPKDPVLEIMFRYISSHVHQKHVATYLKLIFVKLAAVHAMEETDKKEADLLLALQALELDPAKCIIYTREGPARKAYKACRALAQNHKRVSKHSAIKLRRFIYDSGYAINSDSHYSCNESLDLCHPLELRVLVVTHLHLIGGTPSQHKILKKSKRTSYQQFLDLLPGFLSIARRSQTSRLGYSTKAPTDGPWLCQYAASLEALDVDRWIPLCKKTYDVLRHANNQMVFVIHADDQAMPSRIAAKVESCPKIWNSWTAPVVRTTTQDGSLTMPPPDFLPGLLTDTVVAPSRSADVPSAATFSLASHPAPKPTASQISDDEEQNNKKTRFEPCKEGS